MSLAASKRFATANVASGVLLDSRRALVHPGQGWLAVADLHYGYEVHRRRQGAHLPDWGMAQCEAALLDLVRHHLPRRLILVGDIMDGSGSAEQTAALLERLRAEVGELICIEGNHDRPALRKCWNFVKTHMETGFVFHHGHVDRFEEAASGTPKPPADSIFQYRDERPQTSPSPPASPPPAETVIHVTGHEHPAFHFSDGAGLRLKLPAMVQQRLTPAACHWILPAFSPWAAGGVYASANEHLATWVCGPGRVWQVAGTVAR